MASKRRSSYEDNFGLRMAIGAVLLGMVVAVVPLAKAITGTISNDQPFVAQVSAPPGGTELPNVGPVSLVGRVTHPAKGGSFTVQGPSGYLVSINAVADAADPLTWKSQWNLGGNAAGQYALTFSAVRAVDGVTASSQPVPVHVRVATATEAARTSPGTDPNANTKTTTSTAATTAANGMTVAVTSPRHLTTVSGVVPLVVTPTEIADSATFVVSPLSAGGSFFVEAVGSGTTWSGDWSTSSVPNGSYSVFARVFKEGVMYASEPITLTVSNAVAAPTFAISLASPAPGASVQGMAEFKATTNLNASSLTFLVYDSSGASVGTVAAEPSADGTQWRGLWDTTTSKNGVYSFGANALREGARAEVAPRSFSVANPLQPTSVTVSLSYPTAGAALNANVPLRVQTSSKVDAVTFTVTQNFGDRKAETFVAGSSDGTSWTSEFTYAGREMGPYLVSARAIREGTAFDSGTVGFTLVAVPPPPDTGALSPANVTLIAPANGAAVSGSVNVSARTDVAVDVAGFFLRRPTAGEGDQVATATANSTDGGKTWNGVLSLSGVADGTYVLVATVSRGGTKSSSQPVNVTVKSGTATPTASGVRIEVTAPANGATVTGTTLLAGTSSAALDAAMFILEGPPIANGKATVTAVANATKTGWSGSWNSAAAKDGTVSVKLAGNADGKDYVSPARSFVVRNGQVNADAPIQPAPSPTETPGSNVNAPVHPQPQPAPTLSVGIVRPGVDEKFAVGASVPLAARVGGDATLVKFSVMAADGTAIAFVDGAYDTANGTWTGSWRATVADGSYGVMAYAQNAAGIKGQSGRTRFFVGTTVAGSPQTPTATQPTQPTTPTQQPPPPVERVDVIPKEQIIAVVQQPPAETRPVPQVPQPVIQAATQLNAECAARGIAPERCDAWLRQQQAQQSPTGKNACEAAGIVTKEECAAYLQRSNAVAACANGSADPACATEVARATAGLMETKDLQQLRKQVIPTLGGALVVPKRELPQDAPPQGQTPDNAQPRPLPPPEVPQAPESVLQHLPLVNRGDLVVRMHASPGFDQDPTGTTHLTVPAVVMIDSDADGLPDDVERRHGTDPFNPDTDGDSYPDAVEIALGYNPLGEGRLTDGVRLAPIDVAIVSGAPIEQPRDAGVEDPNLSVRAAVNAPPMEGESSAAPRPIILSGTALPGSVVTVFVYSYLPVVFTAEANDDGTWSYQMDDALTDGEHTAFVTVTDDTGKIESKSGPLSFFIAGAQAVSEDDFFDPALQSPLAAAAAQNTEEQLTGLYIGAAAFAVLLALVAAYFIVVHKTRVPPRPQLPQ